MSKLLLVRMLEFKERQNGLRFVPLSSETTSKQLVRQEPTIYEVFMFNISPFSFFFFRPSFQTILLQFIERGSERLFGRVVEEGAEEGGKVAKRRGIRSCFLNGVE